MILNYTYQILDKAIHVMSQPIISPLKVGYTVTYVLSVYFGIKNCFLTICCASVSAA
jgi:hypothetical protein